MVRLSVNVDHVATLRQARRTTYPDPVAAARIARAAGASGVTVHLRGDRRHIQDDDVARLRGEDAGKLNLEMSAADEMLRIALRVRPDQVTLVPENPGEVTTEGGLDVAGQAGRLGEAVRRLAGDGIEVSLFVDPDPRQIAAIAAFAPHPPALVAGVELNTDAYTRAKDSESVHRELRAAAEGASAVRDAGFHLYAGHGLTPENVGPIARIAGMEELNIGHALVSRAVLIGLDAAVREMLRAMNG